MATFVISAASKMIWRNLGVVSFMLYIIHFFTLYMALLAAAMRASVVDRHDDVFFTNVLVFTADQHLT
ncbi:hypothetical protein PE36_18930 [Moritella sp. PE36]|nr:hypothetical protein PE36_18930 [Moritella sp. PE36]